jgi:hypothetical protein
VAGGGPGTLFTVRFPLPARRPAPDVAQPPAEG